LSEAGCNRKADESRDLVGAPPGVSGDVRPKQGAKQALVTFPWVLFLDHL
jgi:hypothetical protein